MWLVALYSVILVVVAKRYFEEILKEFISFIEGSDGLFEYEWARVYRNVCGASEVPEGQSER